MTDHFFPRSTTTLFLVLLRKLFRFYNHRVRVRNPVEKGPTVTETYACIPDSPSQPIFSTQGPDIVDKRFGGEMFSPYIGTLLYHGRGTQGTLT